MKVAALEAPVSSTRWADYLALAKPRIAVLVLFTVGAGLELDPSTLQTLLSIDTATWRQEIDSIGKYLDDFKERVPPQLRDQQRAVAARLA